MHGNTSLPTDQYFWTPESLLEIILPDPDSFLKIRETLTRIGVASKKEKALYQSAHILHKQGRYFLVSFKELFALDGRETDMTWEDISRRNTIAKLLEQWELCKVVDKELVSTSLINIKIVPFKDKKQWSLVQKYTMRSDRI